MNAPRCENSVRLLLHALKQDRYSQEDKDCFTNAVEAYMRVGMTFHMRREAARRAEIERMCNRSYRADFSERKTWNKREKRTSKDCEIRWRRLCSLIEKAGFRIIKEANVDPSNTYYNRDYLALITKAK